MTATAPHKDGSGVVVPVLQEFALAFREVMSDPGRTLRFAGMPTLVMLVLSVVIALMYPLPDLDPDTPGGAAAVTRWEDTVGLLSTLPLAFSVWSVVRMQVWWARWVVAGDDGVAFLSPALGRREMSFFTLSLLALGASGLSLLGLVPVITVVGSGLDLAGVPLTRTVAEQVAVILLPLALPGIAAVYGRLMVGVVPQALGLTPSLRAGWRATRGQTLRLTLLMLLTGLPWGVSELFSHLTDPVEIAASVLIGGLLRTVALAANAVVLARFYTLTLGRPPQPPRRVDLLV